MASVVLTEAMSFHHRGIKFEKGKVTVVTDEIARELAEIPEYFEVAFDGSVPQPKSRKGGVRVVKGKMAEPPAEAPAATEPEKQVVI
jgi:hypothetical protein